MYFSRLTFNLDEATLQDARVTDPDIFEDASIDMSGITRAERAWILERLTALVSAWTGHNTPTGTYTLHEDGHTSTLSDAPAWSSLDDAQRATIRAALDDVLRSVHGLLLIE